MNFAINLALKIFLSGLAILIIASLIIWNNTYNNVKNNELEHTKTIVDKVSFSLEQDILEKVKTTRAIGTAPVIMNALNKSNTYYNILSKQVRSEEIQSQNERWKAIQDHDNPFILEFTNNPVSQYLKNLQNNLKGEFGEIFLTNKYGALVSSTAKLTTFAHGHKYWWKGAFDNGNGAVFFDDRGYDDSVGGYVLGIVVPIKDGNEIIGILKANLNILGSISEIILNYQSENLEEIKLIRSGGLIVFEEGVEPLSRRVPVSLLEKLQSRDESSFICKDQSNDWIVGLSEIKLTSTIEGYNFGGSFESIDHKKGNSGESWYVLDYRPISIIVEPVNNILKRLMFIGLLLAVVLALIALIIAYRTANPIKELMKQTRQIAKGDFDSEVSVKRKDELGLLAKSFNRMVVFLKEKTTSVDRLSAEIKEREKAENTLKESEERFRAIFEQAAVGVVLADEKTGDFVRINQKYLDIVGYTHEELIKLSFKDISHPEDLKEDLEYLRQLRSGLIPSFSMEKRYIKKDGTIVWVKITVSPMLKHFKGANYLIAVVEDISARKKAEQSLKESEKQMRYLNAGKDKFFSIISHDLRSPFHSILGFSDLILDSCRQNDFNEVLEMSTILNETVKKTFNLLNNLLEWSRAQTGRIEFDPDNYQLSALIQNEVNLHSLAAKKKNISIACDCPEIIINFDLNMISTVMRNLLTNAIKYSYEGGEINISVIQKENEVEVSVKDNGIGMSKDHQKKLFQIGENVIMLGTNKEKGTGLGLILCKEFVEKHRGKISVESERGNGARFYFTLPYNPVTEAESKALKEVLVSENKNEIAALKVLIAEDEEIADTFLSVILKNLCNEILHSKNGLEAVELCRRNSDIDLVMMDIKMPGMDGYEATRKIREFNKNVIIIAHTAYAQSGDRKRAIQAGCDDYIAKPSKKDKILEIIKKHLNK